MSGPNLALMRHYGTTTKEAVSRERIIRSAAASRRDVDKLAMSEELLEAAKIAAQCGVDRAKSASMVGQAVGGLIKSPVARKVVGMGAIAAGTYGAAKGIGTVHRAMGQAPAPQSFGGGRFGFQPAGSVNQYGQPQPGSPVY